MKATLVSIENKFGRIDGGFKLGQQFEVDPSQTEEWGLKNTETGDTASLKMLMVKP